MQVRINDSLGNELKIGDLVQIQTKSNGTLTFFTKVQIVNGRFFPTSNFAHDRIVKIDQLPKDVKHADVKDDMPEYWMHTDVELYMIEENILDKWKMDSLACNHNSFITFIQ